ncbi:MAG: hypothetical protein ABI629_13605 [bacterium]
MTRNIGGGRVGEIMILRPALSSGLSVLLLDTLSPAPFIHAERPESIARIVEQTSRGTK